MADPVRNIGASVRARLQNLARTPFTQLANFTGQPAMSVPLHWTREGLPCGVHFMARIADEATIAKLKSWFNIEPVARAEFERFAVFGRRALRAAVVLHKRH